MITPIIRKQVNNISEDLPKGENLYLGSLIEKLNDENVKIKVKELLDNLGLDSNYSCFDTTLITNIKTELEKTNVTIDKEQERVLNRIDKIIKLNVGNLKDSIKTIKLNTESKDQSINGEKNKTLTLLMRKEFNFFDLTYLLNQTLDKNLFKDVFNYIYKNKQNIGFQGYEFFISKLLKNKGVDKEFLMDIISNEDSFLLDEKKLIVESKVLPLDIIKKYLLTKDYLSLWSSIVLTYKEEDLIINLLNKVVDNFNEYYFPVKHIIIEYLKSISDKKIDIQTINFISYIYREDKEIIDLLNLYHK